MKDVEAVKALKHAYLRTLDMRATSRPTSSRSTRRTTRR